MAASAPAKKQFKEKAVTVLIWVTAVLLLGSVVLLGYCIYKRDHPILQPRGAVLTLERPLSVELKLEDAAFSGILTRQEGGVYQLSLSAPEPVKDMVLRYDTATGEAGVSFFGLSAQIAADLPKSSITLLSAALEHAVFEDAAVKNISGGISEVNGRVLDHGYRLTVDANGSGRLSVPDLKLECSFFVLEE